MNNSDKIKKRTDNNINPVVTLKGFEPLNVSLRGI